MSDTVRRSSGRARALLACLTLAAVTFAVFGRVLGHPFIAFDDVELIVRNPEVTGASPLVDRLFTPTTGYVIPVTVAVQSLLLRVSDGAAWSFHAAGVGLHALYTWQLLALARRLGAGFWAAFAATLLFAVHPLVLQPVAWAICIKDLLMANLLLGATHVFLSCAAAHVPGRTGVLCVMLAMLAMLAKPSAALIGFGWLAYLGARSLSHVPAGETAPAPPRAALIATSAAVLAGIAVGAASRYAHDTLLDQAGMRWTPWKPLAVLGRHVANALWPADLLIMYADPLDDSPAALVLLGVVAALAAAVLVVRLRSAPARLLPLALAVCVYLPTSNLLPFARTISDSYMYVPLSALAVLAALLACDRLARARPAARRAAAAVAAALVLLLAAASSAQLPRWRGGAALWEPVVRRYPRLSTAHRLMGDELVYRGRPDLAVEPYRRAFALDYDPRFLLEFGTVLSMAGRLDDAECVLIEAAVFGKDSGYAVYNYAALLAFHPGRAPHHPGVARKLLGELDALRRAGKLKWPAALEAGLQRQRDRVREAPPPPPWRQRSCPMLAAR